MVEGYLNTPFPYRGLAAEQIFAVRIDAFIPAKRTSRPNLIVGDMSTESCF